MHCVLCFSPFTRWRSYSAWEAAILYGSKSVGLMPNQVFVGRLQALLLNVAADDSWSP